MVVVVMVEAAVEAEDEMIVEDIPQAEEEADPVVVLAEVAEAEVVAEADMKPTEMGEGGRERLGEL
jgi:hypothetical protein